MYAEQIIFNVLSTSAPITEVVGQNIYPSVPIEPTLPLVVYYRSDTEMYPVLDHPPTGFQRAEITLQIWANEADTAINLALQIQSLLAGYANVSQQCQGIFLRRQSNPVVGTNELNPLAVNVEQLWEVFSGAPFANPLVGVTSHTTTIAESGTALASGGFQNATGLSCSEGIIVPTSPSSPAGGWTWSEAPPLTEGTHTVTITVTNGTATNNALFTFKATDVFPVMTITGYSIPADTLGTFTLHGTFSDYDDIIVDTGVSDTALGNLNITPLSPHTQSGTYTVTETALGPGVHNLNIICHNSDGTMGGVGFAYSVNLPSSFPSSSSSSSSSGSG
jgi:hypothetical protein